MSPIRIALTTDGLLTGIVITLGVLITAASLIGFISGNLEGAALILAPLGTVFSAALMALVGLASKNGRGKE